MLQYKSKTGMLLTRGAFIATGYSGKGVGKNNPFLQNVPNVGPLPMGVYMISPEPFDSPAHGPFCLRLLPVTGTQTFGRGGFLIHGDSREHPGEASEGCVIMSREIRERIYDEAHALLVVEDW